tara:strand:+ start:204 stop:410 length:207 start_codon:yes stop_codon:yes gene_type:complete
MARYSKDQYKRAYNLLMDYWKYLPDEDKEEIDSKLLRIFGNGNISEPNQDTISKALNRLKKKYGYGIK